jgi:hypothetical protein
MQICKDEYEKQILWPGLLLEKIQTVCQRKENITAAYVENAAWVKNDQSKRTQELNAALKEALNAPNDPSKGPSNTIISSGR